MHSDAIQLIEEYYTQGIYDEFIPATALANSCPILDGDTVLFFNFRADRARQLTEAFTSDIFTKFKRIHHPKIQHFITLTDYGNAYTPDILFTKPILHNTLGAVIAQHGLTQLRLAETEKYAHVTFFLNGGQETPFPGETRQLIPSPVIATYDLQPEMNALMLTDQIIAALQSAQYDLIICNYANADMVGHTGNFMATQQAITYLDHCLQRIGAAITKYKGSLLITADHGNAENMFDSTTQQPHTAHTTNPVPFICIEPACVAVKHTGSLIDVAPSILSLLQIPIPLEMTGQVV